MTRVLRAENITSSCGVTPLIRYIIKHTSVIWISFTLILSWLIPLTQILNDSVNRTVIFEAPYEIGIMFVIPVCMLMAIRTFDYLTKEKATTFFHSLPYSRTKLFVVNGLTGFALIIVPLFFVSVMAMLVSLIKGTGVVLYFFALFGFLSSVCFYVYAFTILMVMLFSNKGSLFPMTAILFCYTEIMFFIINLVISNMYDIEGVFTPSESGLLFLSPLRVCFTSRLRCDYIIGEKNYNYGFAFTNIEKVLPIELICGVLMLALAYVLYRLRKSERSGEVVAFKSCRYIFKWGFSISLAMFMTLIFGITSVYNIKDISTKNLVICAIFVFFALILYMIAEMIISKKFNIFKKVTLELIPVLAVTLILSVLTVTDAFGIKDYVPEPENVKYLTVHIENKRDETLMVSTVTTIHINSDPDNLAMKKAFMDLHKRIVKEKPLKDVSDTMVEFIYYGENAYIDDRRYTIPKEYLDPVKLYIELRKDEKETTVHYGREFDIIDPTYYVRRFISFVMY